MPLNSCIRALEQLAAKENNPILSGALDYYRRNKKLTPKYAAVVFWKLQVFRIDHHPSFFQIELRRDRHIAEARTLLASLERRGGSDPVFWNKLTRRPVGSIDVFWKGVKAEANLPGVRIHDLRHSFASHAAARSETLPMIGKLLGHARLQTTSRYAHLDDGPVLDAAERIGELIAEVMGEDSPLNYNTMCDIGALIHDR